MLKQIITLCFLYAIHAANVIADDIEIYQGGDQGTRPNVMFLLDTSQSMEGRQEITANAGLYNPDIRYHGPFRSDRLYYRNYDPLLRIWTAHPGEYKILDTNLSMWAMLDRYIPIDSFKCQSRQDELELVGYVTNQFLQWNPDREFRTGHTYYQWWPPANIWTEDTNRQGYWEPLQARDTNEYNNESNTSLKRYVDCKSDMDLSPPSGLNAGDGKYMTHWSYINPYTSDENYKIIDSARRNTNPGTGTDTVVRPFGIDRGDWGKIWPTQVYDDATETIFTANYLNYQYYTGADNKNRPARLYVMGDAIADAVANNPGLNIGLARFDGSFFQSSDGLTGGMVTIPMSKSEDSFQLFENTIRDMDPYGGTPLTESYYEVAQFMRGHAPEYGDDTAIYHRRNFVRIFTNPLAFLADPSTILPEPVPSVKESRVGNNPTGIYKSPITQECQANHIVVMSDGEPTSDTYADDNIRAEIGGYPDTPSDVANCVGGGDCTASLAYHLASHDQIDDAILDNTQVIRTHAIGGFLGNLPAAQKLKATKILTDMSETHGQGIYESVENEAELQAHLANLFGGFLKSTVTASAPSVSVNAFNRFEQSDELYYALFKPSSNLQWQGNFKRYRLGLANHKPAVLDSKGSNAIDLSSGFFKDGAQSYWTPDSEGPDNAVVTDGGIARRLSITTPRVIRTSTDSTTDNTDLVALTTSTASQSDLNISDSSLHTKLIQWANGIDVKDRDGDGDYTDARTFMEDPLHSEPTMVVYSKDKTALTSDRAIFIGTNSGFVHSLDINDAAPKENFAFIPKELLQNLDKYYSGGLIHEHKAYGADGPLTHWHDDKNGNGQVDAGIGEKVYLYITLRRGGQSIYALDVTSKNAPKLAWQRHGNYPAGVPNRPVTSTGFENLGQTWARLEPATIAWNNKPRAVVITAGGYDPAEDGDTANNDLIGPLSRTAHNLGTTIYIMDAITGELLWDAKTHTSLPSGIEMTSSFAAHASPIDSTGDGLANMIYAPDVGGRIWRFDIKQADIPNPTDSIVTVSNDFATGRLVADIYDDTSAPADAIIPSSYKPGNRRFFNEIDVIYQEETEEVWLSVGSGYRAHPKTRHVTNYHFIIRDKLEHATPPATILFADLQDWGVSNDSGWKVPLGSRGEKVLSRSSTLGNQILFSTYAPDAVTSSVDCTPNTGQATLYALNSQAGTVNPTALKPKGIPPMPVLVTAPTDTGNGKKTLSNRRNILVGSEVVTDSTGKAVEIGNDHDNISKDYWLETN